MSKEFPQYGNYNLDYYFTEEINEKVTSKRFRVAVYRKGIRLENIDKAPSTPDELLKTVIEHMINDARNDRSIDGKKPEKFSVIFRSTILQTSIQVKYLLIAAYLKKFFRSDMEHSNKIQLMLVFFRLNTIL